MLYLVSGPTRWSLWYWFYVDHPSYFQTEVKSTWTLRWGSLPPPKECQWWNVFCWGPLPSWFVLQFLGSLHAIMLLTGWLECQRLPLRFLWPSHLKVKCYGWVIIFQFYQSLWSQSSCDRKWKLCKWREMPKISSHNRKLSSREIEFGQKITWASISSTEGGNDFG